MAIQAVGLKNANKTQAFIQLDLMSIAKLVTYGSRIGAILWMGLIYYLSSKPVLPMGMLFSWQDKVMHMLFYGVLAFFFAFALGTWQRGLSRKQVAGVTVLACLYGILDEFHQTFVPGRSPSFGDITADTIGALLAASILRMLLNIKLAAHRS